LSCSEITRRMLFRCDGSFKLGMGHLVRCCVLAESLAPESCLFAVCADPLAESFLKRKSLDFRQLPSGLSPRTEGKLLVEYADEIKATSVVLDTKDNGLEVVLELKKAGLFVIDFEDLGPGRNLADILIDPHIRPGTPQARYEGSGFYGFGTGWAVLHPVYAELHKQRDPATLGRRKKESPLEVLVSCGGSDPASLTERILKTLDNWKGALSITVVLGPGARRKPLQCRSHPVEILESPAMLARLLSRSDVAFVSGGITMLESLCLGVATVVVPQQEEQYNNALNLASKDALLLTPPPADPAFSPGLAVVVEGVLADSRLRKSLSQNGWAVVDGRGIERLMEVIKSWSLVELRR